MFVSRPSSADCELKSVLMSVRYYFASCREAVRGFLGKYDDDDDDRVLWYDQCFDLCTFSQTLAFYLSIFSLCYLIILLHFMTEGSNVQVTWPIKTHCNSYNTWCNSLFYIIYFKLSVFTKTLKKFIFVNVSYIDHDSIYKSIKSRKHPRGENTFYRRCHCKQNIIT